MPVILDSKKIFYPPVPKCASTSLVHAFFKLENNGSDYPDLFMVNERRHHIFLTDYRAILRHEYDEARIADYYRFAVVRDPVKRVLSAYRNIAIFRQKLSLKHANAELAGKGLEAMPELDLFVERFEDYATLSAPMWHHTRPICDFLGKDPGYFSRIYNIGELDLLAADISNRLHKPLEIDWYQTDGPKVSINDLTTAQIAKLRRFYRQDYEAYGAFFD